VTENHQLLTMVGHGKADPKHRWSSGNMQWLTQHESGSMHTRGCLMTFMWLSAPKLTRYRHMYLTVKMNWKWAYILMYMYMYTSASFTMLHVSSVSPCPQLH